MNEATTAPVLIAVAPNGARHGKVDHPAVPISPRELAETAIACAEAGAAMIHLHVRDENGRHSLEPERYRLAIEATRQAVGDAMLIQVTSEAAGIYTPQQQMRLIEELAPDAVSLAVREVLADDESIDAAAGFLSFLDRHGTAIQYILYDSIDTRRYGRLVADGVIPAGPHLVLFVLGRYSDKEVTPKDLDSFLTEFDNSVPWMVCAFGRGALDVLAEAASRGGHVRIGFENGWLLPDGSVAVDNATLVRAMATRVRDLGRSVATMAEAGFAVTKRAI